MENEKETKIVFNCGCARRLLKANCLIVDIKPDKDNAQSGKEKSVFVFKKDAHFDEEFRKISEEIKASKEKCVE